MATEVDLINATRASIVAPAGCGKTELIVRAVRSADTGRYLILTHTHAGVRALRERFRRLHVPRERFNVETIAGWSLTYSRAYPVTAVLTNRMPSGNNDWNSVYQGTLALLSLSAIQRVLRTTYRGVFVDEYQDCTTYQHELICVLANILPCSVLGDPLQGIFGFAGASLSWNTVEAVFPPLEPLDYPWRWKGKNERLGQWLSEMRQSLITGLAINLSSAPITWKHHTSQNQNNTALGLLGKGGQVVVIRKLANQAHDFARRIGRGYRSMEEIECKDLGKFAKELDALDGIDRASHIIAFAAGCMTAVKTQLSTICKALEENKLPNVSKMIGIRKEIADGLIAVAGSKDTKLVAQTMRSIEKLDGVRVFRRELWNDAVKTFELFSAGEFTTSSDAAWSIRNRSRYINHSPDRYLVSRTLLIKGLEFDHAMLPNANEFSEADAAKHFYVAATRGAYSLTILSENTVIQFPKPVL